VAQVRVCLICFGAQGNTKRLDGKEVKVISSDLSEAVEQGFGRKDLVRLSECLGVANQSIIPRANINEKERN
jgi:hypothetical protein